jgi:hypothetical protein
MLQSNEDSAGVARPLIVQTANDLFPGALSILLLRFSPPAGAA